VAGIVAAARRLTRHCIIVPNGPLARDAAAQAARELRAEGIEVLVVDVRSAIQALPALAVHERAAGFAADAAAMGRAAAGMRHAAIGPGADLAAAADGLLAGGAELVTFLAGEDAPDGLAELAAARVREVSPAAEVHWHAGAVPGALLLAGAE
jgi:dihydroxyacetone kinase-like predicted kinase